MQDCEMYPSYEIYQYVLEQFAPCMNDYLYIYGIERDTYCISKRAVERFALPGPLFHDVVKSHALFVHPDDIALLTDDLKKLVSGEKAIHDMKYRWIGKDGSPIWINCKGRILVNPEGKHLMVGCINEIGNIQSADNVSGLLGEREFQQQISQLDLPHTDSYLLRIGIDDFKTINEHLGNQYGDKVLHTVAECIRKCLGPDQYAYRLIADEFAVLDLSAKELPQMKALYNRIRSAVDDAVESTHYDALYTISGGLLHLSHDTNGEYSDILRHSEFALNEAKKRGKNQVYIFTREDYEQFLRNRKILIAMKYSISHSFVGFSLNYQPIICVNGEQLYAAETLLRYQTPDGENISPFEFIPILEESGLIIPVGKWILRNALPTCQKCRQKYPDFKMSVNLSYIQLLKSPFFDDIVDALAVSELPASGLIVELTESGQLENSPSIQNVWKKLRNAGVSIAVDDFGTGYSNLHTIGNLKPNIVKIDRNFTFKALQNDYEFQLLIHIIRMVHSLDITLVVEGIETLDELRQITALQPDYIQGYYYSKPCTEEDFIQKYIT